jgi:hypothetical protein
MLQRGVPANPSKTSIFRVCINIISSLASARTRFCLGSNVESVVYQVLHRSCCSLRPRIFISHCHYFLSNSGTFSQLLYLSHNLPRGISQWQTLRLLRPLWKSLSLPQGRQRDQELQAQSTSPPSPFHFYTSNKLLDLIFAPTAAQHQLPTSAPNAPKQPTAQSAKQHQHAPTSQPQRLILKNLECSLLLVGREESVL